MDSLRANKAVMAEKPISHELQEETYCWSKEV